jgi:Ser/Thr protein kinase RdoA (MazF antagonist)
MSIMAGPYPAPTLTGVVRVDEVLASARRLIGPFDVVADLSWKDLDLSVVLEVRTEDGRTLIVKSHHDDFRNHFERDAYRRWVPAIADRAPELVAVDDDGKVLVLTKLEAGPPPDDLPAATYLDAGRVLRRFHDGGERLVDPGWAQQRLDNFRSWIDRMPDGLIADDDVAFAEAEAKVLLDLPPPPLVPAHGDFQPRNWRVDGAGRVFVFDFEKARHDWWIHDIQRMWWREWLGRPSLRDSFLEGYGRELDETEVAGMRANSARGHVVQIIWATLHGDAGFADEGRRQLAHLRTVGL